MTAGSAAKLGESQHCPRWTWVGSLIAGCRILGVTACPSSPAAAFSQYGPPSRPGRNRRSKDKHRGGSTASITLCNLPDEVIDLPGRALPADPHQILADADIGINQALRPQLIKSCPNTTVGCNPLVPVLFNRATTPRVVKKRSVWLPDRVTCFDNPARASSAAAHAAQPKCSLATLDLDTTECPGTRHTFPLLLE